MYAVNMILSVSGHKIIEGTLLELKGDIDILVTDCPSQSSSEAFVTKFFMLLTCLCQYPDMTVYTAKLYTFGLNKKIPLYHHTEALNSSLTA